MRTTYLGFLATLALAAFVAIEAQASKFEPLIVAGKPQGECSVLLPGKSAPVPVELGKAYAYGSVLISGPGASMPLLFGTANECTLSGQGRVLTAQNEQDPKQKLLTLENGRLDVALDAAYQELNALDVASSCVRASFTKGGKASFETAAEGELQLFVITCGDATLKLGGPQFTIPLIDKDDILSIACAPDMSFIRIKDVKGEFEMNIRDADGNPQAIPMQPGAVIKVLQKRSEIENTVVVTILVVGADEAVKQAITYSVKADAAAPAVAVASATAEQKPKQEKAAKAKEPKAAAAAEPKKDLKKGEWTPMWASTTTTSTTTTTTVPKIDAASAEAYRRSRGLIAVSGGTVRRVTTTTMPVPTPTGRT
jgi:hypothetical protein